MTHYVILLLLPAIYKLYNLIGATTRHYVRIITIQFYQWMFPDLIFQQSRRACAKNLVSRYDTSASCVICLVSVGFMPRGINLTAHSSLLSVIWLSLCGSLSGESRPLWRHSQSFLEAWRTLALFYDEVFCVSWWLGDSCWRIAVRLHCRTCGICTYVFCTVKLDV